MSNSRKLFFSWLICCLFVWNITSFADNRQFAAAEHVMLGNEVKLFFSSTDSGQTHYLLTLKNGLKLTYGDIISLGDLYGIVGKPISHGINTADNEKRFMDAFNSFAASTHSKNETNRIMNVIHHEQKLLKDGIAQGKSSEVIYKEMGSETSRQLNCITGGGCLKEGWWLKPGRYLKLANDNFDHFNVDAGVAYRTGHNLAIKEAVIAHNTHDVKRLEIAYAMNAFACHFLSDRFAAGHIRTPRDELSKFVTPATAGSVLARYMHDEENTAGIHVHNLRNNNWVSYGDTVYLDSKNNTNRDIVNETLQLSARQVFDAYQNGYAAKDNNQILFSLVPLADETENNAQQDISALFYWDKNNKKLMRRKDMRNMYDRHWTKDWWGWSTVALLEKIKGSSF